MNMTASVATWHPPLVRIGGDHRVAQPWLGAFVLFIGLSAANAIGGVFQLVFFGVCLVVAVLTTHQLLVKTFALVVLCGVLATLSSLRTDLSLTPMIRFLRPFIEGYLIAIVLYRVCHIYSFESLMRALAGYVLLQFVSAVIMFALPELRTVLLNQWYANESYQGQAFQAALLFRGVGISLHHLYGMPLAVGMIGALLIVAANLQYSWRLRFGLIVTACCAMLVVIPNARIGLVPILICYLLGISVFYRPYFLRHVAVLVVVLIPAMVFLARAYLDETIFDWLAQGFFQFVKSEDAADATTISDLSSMVILPTNGIAWMIGEGRICQSGEDCYSDIGWIRLLQEGGLMLTIAVCALYLHLILRIHRRLRFVNLHSPLCNILSARRLLLWIFILTFVAATIKGDGFNSNDYSRLLMTLAVLVQLPRQRHTLPRQAALPILSSEAFHSRHCK